MTSPLDSDLTDLLGPDAATALARWANMMRMRLGHDRTLVNGRSTATVASVYRWRADGSARKLLLKHDFVADSAIASAEYARQLMALEQAPEDFAGRHMTTWAHEPIAAGNGTWITFQEFVGGGPDSFHAMTAFLAGDPSSAVSGLRVRPVPCDRQAFVDITLMVVRAVLGDWARKPRLQHMPASQFVKLHLEDRADPGRPLGAMAAAHPGPTIALPGEPELTNPFLFLTGLDASADPRVPALLGMAHGDLHTENVLVSTQGKAFKLIDFPRYRDDAPLTRDPVHLMLSIVNRSMDELTDTHRGALLDRLTGSASPQRLAILPAWLTALVDGVESTGLAWIAESSLGREWQETTRLSMLASALIFAARPTTGPAGKLWFLRLAARCAHRFALETTSPPPPGAPSQPLAWHGSGQADGAPPQALAWPDSGLGGGAAGLVAGQPGLGRVAQASRMEDPADNGLAELCQNLGVKRQRAKAHGRGRDLEELVTRGVSGEDIRRPYLALMAAVGYPGTRYVPGAHLGHPLVGEYFRCPLPVPCAREELRGPRGETPVCFVRYGDMSLALG